MPIYEISNQVLASNRWNETGIKPPGIEYLDTRWPHSPHLSDGRYLAPGFMGVFGSGKFAIFREMGDYKFTVPAAAKQANGKVAIRVRVIGAGGTINSEFPFGAGGGYTHGIIESPNIDVGSIIDVTCSSTVHSFGTFLSATGGGNEDGPYGEGFFDAAKVKGGVKWHGSTGAKAYGKVSNTNIALYASGAAGSQLGHGGSVSAGFITSRAAGLTASDAAIVSGGTVGNLSANTGFLSSRGVNPRVLDGRGPIPPMDLTDLILPDKNGRFPFDIFYGGGTVSGKDADGPGVGGHIRVSRTPDGSANPMIIGQGYNYNVVDYSSQGCEGGGGCSVISNGTVVPPKALTKISEQALHFCNIGTGGVSQIGLIVVEW